MKIIAISRFQTTNIGDLMSAPHLYFDYDVEHYDPKHAVIEREHRDIPEADAYICGGGAITSKMYLVNDRPGIKIAWGIGQTLKPAGLLAEHADMLNNFALIGSRDWRVPHTEWVPCVSCMSPLFDKEYEITKDVVLYRNSISDTTKTKGNLMGNTGTFEDTIAFLGSAHTVLTDSYHGAYWATLLGRTAIITHPYSSKFYQYKHQPMIIQFERKYMTPPVKYEGVLEECREANVRFDEKVRDLLS